MPERQDMCPHDALHIALRRDAMTRLHGVRY